MSNVTYFKEWLVQKDVEEQIELQEKDPVKLIEEQESRAKGEIEGAVQNLLNTVAADDWGDGEIIVVGGKKIAAICLYVYPSKHLYLGHDGEFYISVQTREDKRKNMTSGKLHQHFFKVDVEDLSARDLFDALMPQVVWVYPDDDDFS
ncbi:MAG: hypothetical protein LBC95_03345 [Candidatus Nomurabacteria bacterium]|nr:hypothetical protein [Candidatus Nomurabacteria bacterium]